MEIFNHQNINVNVDIELCELSFDDLDVIFHTIISNRSHLSPWLPFVDHTSSVDFTAVFVENYLASNRLNTVYTIRYKQQFAGIIAFKDTDLTNKKTEIGYWISELFQGKGIVIQSCKALIDIAFNQRGLNRIQIKTATENHKSQAIPERLGFKMEGIERDGELHSRGFVDLYIFSLLKKDL